VASQPAAAVSNTQASANEVTEPVTDQTSAADRLAADPTAPVREDTNVQAAQNTAFNVKRDTDVNYQKGQLESDAEAPITSQKGDVDNAVFEAKDAASAPGDAVEGTEEQVQNSAESVANVFKPE
jgi:hypothetical protein